MYERTQEVRDWILRRDRESRPRVEQMGFRLKRTGGKNHSWTVVFDDGREFDGANWLGAEVKQRTTAREDTTQRGNYTPRDDLSDGDSFAGFGG